MLRKLVCFFICIGVLFGCAAAEQEVVLPGGRFAVDANEININHDYLLSCDLLNPYKYP